MHSKGNHKRNKKTIHRMGKYLQTKQLTKDYSLKHTRTQVTQYQKNDSIKNWAEDLNRHFLKRDIHMTTKTYEKLLNPANY